MTEREVLTRKQVEEKTGGRLRAIKRLSRAALAVTAALAFTGLATSGNNQQGNTESDLLLAGAGVAMISAPIGRKALLRANNRDIVRYQQANGAERDPYHGMVRSEYHPHRTVLQEDRKPGFLGSVASPLMDNMAAFAVGGTAGFVADLGSQSPHFAGNLAGALFGEPFLMCFVAAGVALDNDVLNHYDQLYGRQLDNIEQYGVSLVRPAMATQ